MPVETRRSGSSTPSDESPVIHRCIRNLLQARNHLLTSQTGNNLDFWLVQVHLTLPSRAVVRPSDNVSPVGAYKPDCSAVNSGQENISFLDIDMTEHLSEDLLL